MKLKCVIIDDEEYAIESITKVIKEISYEYPMEIVKTYTSSVEALNEINNIDFNLLFIDYEMPGYNGVELVQKITKKISVIFVSSFKSKSIDISNEVNFEGFLTKPPQIEVLRNIIKNKNLVLRSSTKIEKIIIPSGKNKLYFDKDEIYYIESNGETKSIFDENGKVIGITNISFTELSKILQNYGFEKISRSHMINVANIRKKTLTKIILKNKTELSIGESKKDGLFQRLNNWFKSN